jgi:Family of unknown function (DUF5407)
VTADQTVVTGELQAGTTNDSLLQLLVQETTLQQAEAQIAAIEGRAQEISIGDMFEMQMLMNSLSQLSEMTQALVSADDAAITSMARNIKG